MPSSPQSMPGETAMSWVCNVLVLYSLGEEWIDTDDDDVEYIGTSPCLLEINRWLGERGWVELLDLGEVGHGIQRHAFEVRIWGAAFNFLDIDAFLLCVKEQAWREPENVQVMIKDQEDERFTLYSFSEITTTHLAEE
jgi:hypothetical protein